MILSIQEKMINNFWLKTLKEALNTFGEAFINSGFAFDTFLKKQTIAIKKTWQELNE